MFSFDIQCLLKLTFDHLKQVEKKEKEDRVLLALYGFAPSFLTDLPQCFDHFAPPFLQVCPSVFYAFAPFS